ncbi:fimbrial protein [Escherichia coli]|uniref:Fimbrial protein n=3 Tax=Bacteria TaxID=2 RepID=A0A6D0HK37_ECOLX|nr:fimbrial protein [Escherichia coli]KAE9728768.1 fimbrial protein [Escherichia coli]KAE9729791.1 fimbrial protein [Escherichia coli]MVV61130.1 fimbrial protein [Escherichia coli]MVV70507.1 fimbrial protein [Escherichia coli]MWN41777.1 fimbrial protein [Escherichia coli]
MTKTIMAGAIAMTLLSFGVNAAGNGQGQVNFKGTIISSPCGIASESANQTIDFGQISSASLNAGNHSKAQDVEIKLVNCELNGAQKSVNISFSGSAKDNANTELGTTGDTKAVIKMSTAGGDFVVFDGNTSAGKYNLKEGDNTMRYSAWVQKANGETTVQEGEFSAVANFNLSYQ